MNSVFRWITGLAFVTLNATASAAPEPAAPVVESPPPWIRPTFELRLRAELVDEQARQDFRERDRDRAIAYTMRTRLGLETRTWNGLQAFAELEHTEALDRDSYQGASAQGLGRRKSIVADPESNELNQAWIKYSNERFNIKAGIQRLILDNARFVGNVGWRQNEQTYDGVTLNYQPIDNMNVFYGYLYNVHRIFGSQTAKNKSQREFDSSSHLVNVSYQAMPSLKLTSYAYLLDLENEALGDLNSNNTYGASLTGTLPVGPTSFSYRLEYARQQDAADNATSYTTDYLHGYGSVKYKIASFGVGYEKLGASNGVGFNTPLATLHAFNGFADLFLDTPGVGLQDIYYELGFQLPYKGQLSLAYHDYVAEDSSMDLGYEHNVVLSFPLKWGLRALFKGAFYQAESRGFRDTKKMIFQLEYTLPGPAAAKK